MKTSPDQWVLLTSPPADEGLPNLSPQTRAFQTYLVCSCSQAQHSNLWTGPGSCFYVRVPHKAWRRAVAPDRQSLAATSEKREERAEKGRGPSGGGSKSVKSRNSRHAGVRVNCKRRHRPCGLGFAQLVSAPGQVDANLVALEECVARLAASGADLVVTPECFLFGCSSDTAAACAEAPFLSSRVSRREAVQRDDRLRFCRAHR